MSNGAIVAATIVPAMMAALQEQLRARFREAKATSPHTAIPFKPERDERMMLDQALKSGEIKETAEGLLWLDEDAIRRAEARAGKVIGIVGVTLTAVLVIVLGAVLLFG